MEKQVFNPYLPSYEYVPDGEPHVFGSRVYVYGSHDRFNGKAFCVRNYVCWSAPVDDLTDWRFEGEIYRKDQDRYLPDAKDRRLFAPDVQKGPDGRYYLYYAFDFSGVIGVAVCDTPAGKYEYYGNVHYELCSEPGRMIIFSMIREFWWIQMERFTCTLASGRKERWRSVFPLQDLLLREEW